MDTLLKNAPFLEYLQANIVEANGREHNCCMFLSFHADARQVRDFVTANFLDDNLKITTALDCLKRNDRDYRKQRQHARTHAYSDARIPQETQPIICFHLTYKGLEKLQIPDLATQFEPHTFFKASMQDRYTEDARANWDSVYTADTIDAMVFLASDDLEKIESLKSILEERVNSTYSELCSIVQVEHGQHQYDDEGYVREAFGFRDGLSKIQLWENGQLDTKYLCDSFLKKEDTEGRSYGSFFVFQKYHQKVAVFQQKIKALASDLGISEAYAEAQVVGRFKDGTPLLLSDEARAADATFNAQLKAFDRDKIDYTADEHGAKCPFHSHARKMNPRDERFIKGSIAYKTNPDDKFLIHLLRRGIGYDYGEADKGLLFMSYQASIRSQFWQVLNWAENPVEPGYSAHTGDDPLLAEQPTDKQYAWNTEWGNPGAKTRKTHLFSDVVCLKGGVFFYTPSTLFLEQLRMPVSSEKEEHMTM